MKERIHNCTHAPPLCACALKRKETKPPAARRACQPSFGDSKEAGGSTTTRVKNCPGHLERAAPHAAPRDAATSCGDPHAPCVRGVPKGGLRVQGWSGPRSRCVAV